MTGLVIMIVCCTVLAAFSQKRDKGMREYGAHKKDRLFFTLLTCYMIIFAGLRVSYNDTQAYISNFRESLTFPAVLTDLSWDLGNNPGFKIFTSIVKTFTNNPNTFLMICSTFVLSVNLCFIHRYTKSLTFSVFIFFTMGYYLFTLAAIKQTMATAIALIALRCLLRRKRVMFFLLLALGATIHPYCLLYLCAPLLMKQVPWKKGTWLLIILVVIIASSFNVLLQTIMDITDIMGEGYDKDTFIGEGVNIFRVFVYFVPVVISFLWRRRLFEHSKEEDNLFVNCVIVCALIMFIGMFGNANMFARLAMYFEPPIYIALPWMLYKLRDKMEGFFISTIAYVSYPLYFYYMTVLNKPFDVLFKSISIGEYIASLFSG